MTWKLKRGMTVKHLKRILEKLADDTKVYLADDEHYYDVTNWHYTNTGGISLGHNTCKKCHGYAEEEDCDDEE